MKNYIIVLCFLISIKANAQRTDFINSYITPIIQRDQITPFNCNGTVLHSDCNIIQNGTFLPNVTNFDPIYPFNSNQVSKWVTSHGSPNIYVANPPPGFVYPLPPAGVLSYAMSFCEINLFSYTPGVPNGEGVAQKIKPLNSGTSYQLTFKELLQPMFSSPPGVSNIKVVLMHCNDFNNIQSNNYDIPVPPSAPTTQTIYCGLGAPLNSNWTKRAITFTATSDFDVIMVYPEFPPTNNPYAVFLATTDLQLTTLNSLSVNAAAANNCITNVSPSCILNDITYTWTSPAPYNQTYTGTSLSIDASIPANVGTWTVATSSTSLIVNSNNTCSTNGYVPLQASFTIAAPTLPCTAPPSNCINLPLIQ